MEDKLIFTRTDVSMSEFARHRGQELALLTQIVENGGDGSNGHSRGGSNKRVFQQLPRHMRRRAMSHNAKRVPRRLMEIHKKEIEKFPTKESKRPSRRFRRRPKQLLQEYNRRQRKFIWLETHIWHAKRFNMTPKWGYKVPIYPSDKSWRACYHGSQRAALIQDLSYMCCIQLSGSSHAILEKLRLLTNTDCGLTLASVMSRSGNRECSCVIYHRDSYPYGAICNVTFFWRPNTSQDGSSLWMWSHPSSFDELLSELISTFAVERVISGEDPYSEKLELLKKSEFQKLSPKLTPFYERTPLYKNNDVTLTVLKDTLVRFRIIGRWATAILTQTLHPATIDESHPTETKWWMKCNEPDRQILAEQNQFWEKLKEQPYVTQVAPGTIVGLLVRDPREQLPIQHCKIPPTMPDSIGSQPSISLPHYVNYSAIWEQEIRDEVTFTKKSDAEMNSLRANNLLPGSLIDLGSEGSRIPILLVQQPCTHSISEVDSGWDIIIPAGWAMAFWIALIYRGARAGGYRENCLLSLEFGEAHFPDEYPDTLSSKSLETTENTELTDKYFRYPPNKRPNYVKLGVATPFSFPWSRLLKEWASKTVFENVIIDANPSENFFVVRNRKVIKKLQNLASKVDRLKCDENEAENILGILGFTNFCKALVACTLRASTRGCLTKFALICKPCDTDMQRKSKNDTDDLEPHHRDDTKKLRKLTKRQKKSSDTNLDDEVRDKLLANTDVLFSTPDELISNNSKPLMGFVKNGQFSLSKGKSIGIGFVSLIALLQLLNESKRENTSPFFYIRSTHSFQYRTASFTIM
ncbi:Ribonucleases P/MRP protein subunit pop1 [Chamberlinius hualienensis]